MHEMSDPELCFYDFLDLFLPLSVSLADPMLRNPHSGAWSYHHFQKSLYP